MSGFFLAAARVASPSRKPTVVMMLHFCCTIWLMLSAYCESPVDSTLAVWMPNWVAASVWPLSAVWLKPLSSKPPESETMHALKFGLAGTLEDGAAADVVSVGAVVWSPALLLLPES